MKLGPAVIEAIRYSEEHDILKEYFEQIEQEEVIDMVSVKWDPELAKQVWMEEAHEAGFSKGRAEGMAKGRAEGRAEGQKEGKAAMVLELLRAKQPLEFIARISKFSVENIAEIGKAHGIPV